MNSDWDEEQIIRYLLGELPSSEELAIETSYLEDHAYFEGVCAIESELIEDYLSGGLSAKRRAQFEKIYRASSRRWARVESARKLREGLKVHYRSADSGEIAPRQTAPSSRKPFSFFLVLAPGLARDSKGRPATPVDEGTELVLDLILNTSQSYDGFSARLLFAQDETVAVSPELNLSMADGDQRVRWSLPVENFRPGDYRVDLFGVAGGATGLIDRYYFRIHKRFGN